MQRMNWGKTFVIGLGFFGVSVLWSLYNTYVPLLLDQRFGMDSVMVGFFMSLDNIAALFIQPPVGALSDRLRTPLGRRLPFILIGAPIAAIAFGLIPLANALPLFVACTVTTILSMAFWRTPVVALMPDVTPSRYRSQANGIINFMGGLGVVIGTSVGSMLVKQNEAYPFWFGSALVLLAAVLVLIFVKEPKVYDDAVPTERPNLWAKLGELFRGKMPGLRIFLAILFWFIAYNAIEAFLSLYGVNHLGLSTSEAGKLITSVSFAFLIFAIPAGYIGGRFGRRNTILTGLTIMIAATLSIFFMGKETLTSTVIPSLPILGRIMPLTLVLMLAGVGWSLININSLPMVVDLTEPIYIGTFTGLYYLFSTLAAIIGPNLNGWIVKLAGNDYGAIMFAAPIFFTIALISMAGVKAGEAHQEANILPQDTGK